MIRELASLPLHGGSTATRQVATAAGVDTGEQARIDTARPAEPNSPAEPSPAPASEESDAAADSKAAHRALKTLHAFLDPEHLPANDDFETAGELSRLLKRRRRRSFAIAALAGGFSWIVLCGLLLPTDRQHAFSSLFVQSHASVLTLVFLGLFGFLFLLIETARRSRELYATTQSLIEVVLRVASPAAGLAQSLQLSEQVSSEVGRIDASLEKTIARGAQVRASLTAERDAFVQAQEKASQELSALIAQMANERAALVVDGENMRRAISNAQRYVNLDIRNAIHQFTQVSDDFKEKVNQAFVARDRVLETRLGDICKDCMAQIDSVVEASIVRVTEKLDERAKEFSQVLSTASDNSNKSLVSTSEEHLGSLDKMLNTLLSKANLDADKLSAVETLIERLATALDNRMDKLNTVLISGITDLHKSTKNSLDGHTVQVETLRDLNAGIKSEMENLIGRLSEQMLKLRTTVVLPLNDISTSFDSRENRFLSQADDITKSFASIVSERTDAAARVLDDCSTKVEKLLSDDSIRSAAETRLVARQDRRHMDDDDNVPTAREGLADPEAPEDGVMSDQDNAGASPLATAARGTENSAKTRPPGTEATQKSAPLQVARPTLPDYSRQDRTWLTDLLERASREETANAVPEKLDARKSESTKEVFSLLARDIHRFVNADAVGELWIDYRAGRDADFAGVYTKAGTIRLRRLRRRLEGNEHLRDAVEIYLKEFTRTLMRLPQGNELTEYMKTDAGMTYTVLIDAMGAFRLRSI